MYEKTAFNLHRERDYKVQCRYYCKSSRWRCDIFVTCIFTACWGHVYVHKRKSQAVILFKDFPSSTFVFQYVGFFFSNAHILNDLQYIHEFAILLKCNIYYFAFSFIVLFSVTIYILAYVGIYFGHTQLSISSSVTLIFRKRTCNVCRFPPFLIKGSRTVYKALHNSNSNIRLGG